MDSFWWVILVSAPDYRVVPNPQNRYNLNTNSGLEAEDDGSLKIAIAPQRVEGSSTANGHRRR